MSITLNFTPTPIQQRLMSGFKRFNVWVVHRGAGKSYLGANLLKLAALADKTELPVYVYMAPELGQAKKIAFDLLTAGLEDIPGTKVNNTESYIKLGHNDAKIYVVGLSEPERLRGLHLNGLVIDEFGDIPPEAYGRIIRPTLERKKGWSVMIGTPKQGDQLLPFYTSARDDQTGLFSHAWVTVEDSGIYSKEEITALRGEYESRGDLASFMQEYMNEPAALHDSFYFRAGVKRLRDIKHIGEFPYLPSCPVYLAVDCGLDAIAAWSFQNVRGTVRLIDFFQVTGAKIPVLIDYLLSKPYTYSKLIVPHDSDNRSVNTDLTIRGQLESAGFRTLKLPRVPLGEGVIDAQALLKICQFDASCKEGIEYLENYSSKVDKKTGIALPAPRHDINSHAADAFRYLALGYKKLNPTPAPGSIKVDHNYNYLDS